MNWAVIMAGGRGTRFWPESRASRPKPFLPLLGRRTLLEETVARLSPFIPPRRTVLVLQSELRKEARRLLKKVPPENILGEPIGRNTAPCSVYAASWISARDPDARFIFLPADQHITPKSLFQKTLRAAFERVDERPVLLGMKPDLPETGYGYLEVGRPARKIRGISYFTVTRFREKPNRAEAKRFLKRGNFLWNGGTFVWRSDAFKRAVRKYFPRLYPAFGRLGERNLSQRKLFQIYRKLPSISIDYAVMEKMKKVHCLLAPFQWSDLGGWRSLSRFWPKDASGNRIQALARSKTLLLLRSRNNIVKAGGRLIALLGVKDLIVVDTRDVLLICPSSEAERIREVVNELEKQGAREYL